MIPPLAADTDESQARPSYAGLFVAAPQAQVLQFLEESRFSGWLGPQQGQWVLAVAENPLGRVAGNKRALAELGSHVAARTGELALAVRVDREERLQLWLFRGTETISTLDTDPPDDEAFGGGIAVDEFGEPMMTGGGEVVLDEFGDPVGGEMFGMDEGDEFDEFEHAPIARAFGRPEVSEELSEVLQESLSEDQSESERLTVVVRLLGLPTWLVSSTSLPKAMSIGPDKSELIRLQAGRQGASGWITGAVSRKLRGSKPTSGD